MVKRFGGFRPCRVLSSSPKPDHRMMIFVTISSPSASSGCELDCERYPLPSETSCTIFLPDLRRAVTRAPTADEFPSPPSRVILRNLPLPLPVLSKVSRTPSFWATARSARQATPFHPSPIPSTATSSSSPQKQIPSSPTLIPLSLSSSPLPSLSPTSGGGKYR